MSVKIIRSTKEIKYNPNLPLEIQARGAEQIIINYNPGDPIISSFIGQFERIAKMGLSFQPSIKFNSNNFLCGYADERYMEKLSKDLEINEIAKMMVKMHQSVEKRLNEMSELCERAKDEQ